MNKWNNKSNCKEREQHNPVEFIKRLPAEHKLEEEVKCRKAKGGLQNIYK